MKLVVSGAEYLAKDWVSDEISALVMAGAAGFKFLVVDAADETAYLRWIAASFFSPLAVVPISPALPPNAKEELLRHLPEASYVLSSSLSLSGPTVVSREKRLSEPWAVLFTSGSTGTPKGVVMRGGALQSAARKHEERFAGLPWLLNLPLFHVGGFSILSRAFFLNGKVIFEPGKFSSEKVWRSLGGDGPMGLSLVPTTLRRVLEEKADYCPSSVEAILLGGAACADEVFERAVRRGFPLLRTYGMTETLSQFATEERSGTGMAPLTGNQVKISKLGEVLVASESLASGYLVSGKITPLPESEGFFPTGDLGEFSNGRLAIYGRKSELIISGGMNVFPQEIERHLEQIPSIADAAVCGVESEEWGEAICVAVVPKERMAFQRDDWMNCLAKHLDGRKLPKFWIEVGAIPRNANGKVLRRELKKMAEKVVR